MKLTCLACGAVNRVPEARLGAGPKCGVCGEKLLDGKVRQLDPATLDKAVRADGLPLVVDFWAPWCGPCRQMAPEVAKASATLAQTVRFAKINTEDHPEAGTRHGIRGIPALVGFRGGREAGREVGARPAAAVEAWARGLAAPVRA
jgi:thioredoxin 2